MRYFSIIYLEKVQKVRKISVRIVDLETNIEPIIPVYKAGDLSTPP
jgi:hypothetical protein